MSKRSAKIRKPAEARISADEQLRGDVDRVGAAVGSPAAQRGHHAVAIIATSIDRAGRPIGQTLRKLTRAERLHRSGAIDDRHAKAIALYVAAADEAYAGCVRVADYAGSGGSSPTGSAAAAHGRLLDGVGASRALDHARAALPGGYVVAFDRIVLDNHPIGLVGADMWPGSSVGAVSGAVRDLVRTCADRLALFYGLASPDEPRMHLAQTMDRFDRQVRAEQDPPSMVAKIASVLDGAEPGAVLMLAPWTADNLKREAGLAETPEEWLGHRVVVVERWRYGWLVQAPHAKTC